ncbi:MAG TPA: trypsin-like peptidase domain-containing protein [Vicinamibacterales bacterium]|nr:trypsin-like peptidase domain-containing protein [Vicinamibacterales bacterium]
MSRPFAVLTLALTTALAFVIGVIVAGTAWLAPVPAAVRDLSPASPVGRDVSRAPAAQLPAAAVPAASSVITAAGLVNFADVAERINPAVVNIEATTRSAESGRRRRVQPDTVPFDEPPAAPGIPVVRPQSGSGFVIERNGLILTNFHVIQGAERIMVKFSDGRNLVAHPLGVDPDTDIALIKVEGTNFPVAPLGNSESLRVGEWVCAIGNPLAYEHTVTVGVVSYLGRKLFDSSLDNYIQTDAAINFGNSGGPLINGRGEVVGINAAISQRASNIGFAVPINEATAILPQLKSDGHVSRGFMGVTLTDVDPDLQASLKLGTFRGALVQDVAAGSPGQRAGLHVYDLITAIDGKPVAGNDEIIREVARRGPGTIAQIQIMRDGRQQVLTVRLSERPSRQSADALDPTGRGILPAASASPLGMTVRDIDRDAARRLRLPDGISGALVTRVEPLSAAWDAGIQRDYVVLEINRRPVDSADAYNRMTRAVHPGDVLAVYVYVPGLDQRAIRAVRVDAASGNSPNR